jgi:hypothetical protein
MLLAVAAAVWLSSTPRVFVQQLQLHLMVSRMMWLVLT